jgi:hypothetical protein
VGAGVEAAAAPSESGFGESRWPPAAALVVYMALNISARIWLPGASAVRVPWLVPGVEAALLLLLLFGDPARLGERRERVRPFAVTLIVLLVAAALWATVLLVYDLIHGSGVTNSPTRLLASGALVWLGNNLSFALLYWLIDSGGPIARWRNPAPIDFAFTQQMSRSSHPPAGGPSSSITCTSASRTRRRSAPPTSCR